MYRPSRGDSPRNWKWDPDISSTTTSSGTSLPVTVWFV